MIRVRCYALLSSPACSRWRCRAPRQRCSRPAGRSSNAAAVTALSVTHRSVVWAVGRVPARLRARAALGHRDARPLDVRRADDPRLRGGPERGFGIAAGRDLGAARLLGDAHRREHHRLPRCGRRRRRARPRAGSPFASGDVDASQRPIVLGVGTQEGVPYAVGSTVTYVERRRRAALPRDARRPGAAARGRRRLRRGARVAALADGEVVVLSRTGAHASNDRLRPGRGEGRRARAPGELVVQAGNDGARRDADGDAPGGRADARLPPAGDRLRARDAGALRGASATGPTRCCR